MPGFKDPFHDPKVEKLIGSGQGVVLGNGTPRPHTQTTKILQDTQINLSMSVNGETREVTDYILHLVDRGEHVHYMYRFTEEVRTVLQKMLEDLPHAGEKVDLEEED